MHLCILNVGKVVLGTRFVGVCAYAELGNCTPMQRCPHLPPASPGPNGGISCCSSVSSIFRIRWREKKRSERRKVKSGLREASKPGGRRSRGIRGEFYAKFEASHRCSKKDRTHQVEEEVLRRHSPIAISTCL